MHRSYTPAKSAGERVIVFDMLNGHKSLNAGLFTPKAAGILTDTAHRQGLLTVRVPATTAPGWLSELPRGRIARDGSLRVQNIRSELLRQLPAMHRVSGGGRRKVSNGSDNPAEIASSAPTVSEPTKPAPANVDLGPNLLGAYRLLDGAGIWLERLQTELGELLSGIGKASDWSFLKESGSTDYDAYSGGDSWVLSGWRWTFPARLRRRRVGTLSMIVDIGKPGRPAAAIGVPCILVAWSSEAHDWAAGIDGAAGFWPPATDTTRLVAERLVQWTGHSPGNGPSVTLPLRDAAWFYLVPLSALDSLDKLRGFIVQPALSLLAGSSVDAAFANAPEILRFAQRKGELVMRS